MASAPVAVSEVISIVWYEGVGVDAVGEEQNSLQNKGMVAKEGPRSELSGLEVRCQLLKPTKPATRRTLAARAAADLGQACSGMAEPRLGRNGARGGRRRRQTPPKLSHLWGTG